MHIDRSLYLIPDATEELEVISVVVGGCLKPNQ